MRSDYIPCVRKSGSVHAALRLASLIGIVVTTSLVGQPGWTQWGRTPQHSGTSRVGAQSLDRILANVVYDPFVQAQQNENGGDLLAHYPAPLVNSGDVFMEFKTGSWIPCSPPGLGSPFPCGSNAWESQIWNIKRLSWTAPKSSAGSRTPDPANARLVEQWTFASDWKPEPDRGGLGGWEPVFHAALSGAFLYVPGAGGSVYRLRRSDGAKLAKIDPFADPNIYVSGPLTVDQHGNVYYNAIKLDPQHPWGSDVPGAWLVKITPDDRFVTVAYNSITPGAPPAGGQCLGSFTSAELPWPPSPLVKPLTSPCGSERPGVNIAPAIAPDGTIYTVSRAHFNSRYAFLVAVNPDFTPKWTASLRGRLSDGCGTPTLPPNGSPGGCRAGAALGVEPATNDVPAGQVIDLSSSSPVIAPDGSVLYGAFTSYNYQRGHLFHFAADGTFLNAYDFGWDTTPAIAPHDGTYSVVLKDNHYATGSYCGSPDFCPVLSDGPYSITSLSPSLKPEWSFTSTNTKSCQRLGDGTLDCVDDHPGGFEWCINAPAVDAFGVVYANSEDGRLYAIGPDGKLRGSLFLNLALGAAYTPLAIGDDGRIYTENDGRLFVVGGSAPPVRPSLPTPR